MKRVKAAFYKLSISEKIQRGYAIQAAMDKNPLFPAPVPSLEQLGAALEKLEEAAMQARHGDKVKQALMVVCEDQLDVLIASLAGYVQSVTRGDIEMVLSSGFDVQNDRSPSRPATTPTFVQVKPGRLEGEVQVRWDRVPGARSYTPQISKDNGLSWEDCPTITRTRMIVPGLPSGSRPWFRVSCFGITGHSDWSDAAQGKVA
jgi:hypothetical protein